MYNMYIYINVTYMTYTTSTITTFLHISSKQKLQNNKDKIFQENPLLYCLRLIQYETVVVISTKFVTSTPNIAKQSPINKKYLNSLRKRCFSSKTNYDINR